MSAGAGIGAATNVVGGIMSAAAATMEQRAMFQEYQKELARQGVYQQQATQAFTPNIAASGSQAAQGDLRTAAQNRESQYNAIGDVPLSISGTGDESAAYKALDQAALGQRGQERAALGAYGDWQQQLGIGNQGVQRQLNQITNFAGGTASVEPYRMYEAQHSQDELAFWGAMISSIGGSAANYAQMFSGPQAQGAQQNPQLAPSYQQAYSQPAFQQGFNTPYGQVPYGWQNLGGSYEGSVVPG